MKPNCLKPGHIVLAAFLMIPGLSWAARPAVHVTGAEDAELVLTDFTQEKLNFTATHANVTFDKGARITFTKEHGTVEFTAPAKGWNLDNYSVFVADIRNDSDRPLSLEGHIAKSSNIRGYLYLEPKEEGAMIIYLMRRKETLRDSRTKTFPGMRGVPGGFMWHYASNDWGDIRFFLVKDMDGTAVGKNITILDIRGYGKNGPLPEDVMTKYFPFIDEFGQFKHEDWQHKVKSVEDMHASLEREKKEIARAGRPKDWCKYGGWKNGPQRKATGHFRVEKVDGKWWMVDPEGHLFWSNGICGVRLKTGKEGFYYKLPQGFTKQNVADYFVANLKAKYGEKWKTTAREHILKRMSSWGMNTFANWSSPEIYRGAGIAYTVYLDTRGERATPEKLRQRLRKLLEEEPAKGSANDPWCIGYFIDNEIKWDNEEMDPEVYYRICREESRRAAPNKLYLGSRLEGHIGKHGGRGMEKDRILMKTAPKYVDVLSINRYRFSLSDLMMTEGTDVPILVGEYHFGAADRGLMHPAYNGSVGSQKLKYYASRHYLNEGLLHPHIVGVHWWTYNEKVMGTQVGCVDITDTPYDVVIKAFREVGFKLYETRMNGKRPQY